MAKANIVMPDGTKVQIEGTAEDVALLLTRFSGNPPVPPAGARSTSRKPSRRKATSRTGPVAQRKDGPTAYIATLATEGFFKSKRSLPDIQKKLEELGHIYAQTSLSPIVKRLTVKRALRRIKEKDGWMYVA